MRRLVYLYELDSVRNSPQEIQIGQQALFEEIVKKGNTVVLSFNQLTDSEAFLCAVRNKDAYADILNLFSLGALKVSRYGKVNTPSKYIQNAIKKCNAPDQNSFLFSGIPVLCTEVELLSEIQKALQYSDTGNLEILLQNANTEQEKERLDYILRFIRMILIMSLDNSSGNPPKTSAKKSFTDFLALICSFENHNDIVKQYPSMAQAVQILKTIETDIRNDPDCDNLIQNRTNWIFRINHLEKTESVFLAEAIIDLCYNYTVEDSIYNVSKHYYSNDPKSFECDFLRRLDNYWKTYSEGNHTFHKGDSNEQHTYKISLPPWDTAIRIITEDQKLEKYRKNKISFPSGTLYENNYAREQKLWNKHIFHQMLSRLRTALIYILIFCIVNYLMGLIEENFLGLFNSLILNQVIRLCGTTIFSTIMFGIIGSLISKWFHLPDILESVQNIGIGIKDIYRIIRFSKKAS